MRYFILFFSYLLAFLFLALNLAIFIFVYRQGIYQFWILLVLTYLLNLIIILIIFFQKRHESAKLSWIIVMTLFPLAGHFLYLLSGQKYRRRKSYAAYTKDYSQSLQPFQNLIPQYQEHKTSLVLKQLSNFARHPVLGMDSTVYHRPYEYFEALFSALKKAQKQILLVTFSVAEGDIFSQLVTILAQKKAAGLEIKWLVDDFGRRQVKKSRWKALRALGIEISFIAPLHFIALASINFYRNHRKFIIIDQQEVFNGGTNLRDYYASLETRFGFYSDFNYSLRGPFLVSYFELFCYMWTTWNKENTKVGLLEKIQEVLKNGQEKKWSSQGVFFEDGPDLNTSLMEKVLIKLITSAKKSIKISTPYFSLPESVLKVLRIALMSGVKVDIHYPGITKQSLIHKIGINEFREFNDPNLNVYHSQGFFNHAKLGLFDDQIAFMGTVNMDIRSLYSQYETIDVIEGNIIEPIKDHFAFLEASSELAKHLNNKSKNILLSLIYRVLKPIV